jgi:hypothetical protein
VLEFVLWFLLVVAVIGVVGIGISVVLIALCLPFYLIDGLRDKGE